MYCIVYCIVYRLFCPKRPLESSVFLPLLSIARAFRGEMP